MGAFIYNILAVIGGITVFSVVVMFVIMGIEAIIRKGDEDDDSTES